MPIMIDNEVVNVSVQVRGSILSISLNLLCRVCTLTSVVFYCCESQARKQSKIQSGTIAIRAKAFALNGMAKNACCIGLANPAASNSPATVCLRHRHRRPLRTRGEWPCGSRATEQCDEIASLHVLPSMRGLHPTTPGRKYGRCASQQIRRLRSEMGHQLPLGAQASSGPLCPRLCCKTR
jgi:hypothetical protein